MDGFDISSVFHPKEVSILNVYASDPNSMFTDYYQLGTALSSVSRDDLKHIRYVTRCVHGLSYANAPSDRPRQDLNVLLLSIIDDAKLMGALIGYKGGWHERYTLTTLGCTHSQLINIEQLRCPKFHTIREHFPIVDTFESCDRHAQQSRRNMCSRVKLNAYRVWLHANGFI